MVLNTGLSLSSIKRALSDMKKMGKLRELERIGLVSGRYYGLIT